MTTTETAINGKVHALLLEQVEEGTQIGTQVCAYRHGELIVDAWAGEMGPEDPRPIEPDTLFSSFSTTKGVAATALHILADRGIIDYDASVASYWPEFGQHGKERITVAQAMSHQSGIHTMPSDPVEGHKLLDWDQGLRYVASAVPAWEPGTATGYHAVTYGWIAGGIIQHASGRHIQEVVEEEIAKPLGVSGEMYIGIPSGIEDRLATLQTAPPPTDEQFAASPLARLGLDHDFFKAMPPTLGWNYNDMEVRQACIPAANGHFSARALASMYGALANGGEIDGVRLVSPERIPLMSAIQRDDVDRVIMMPLRKSIGYFNGGKTNGVHGATGPRITAFGHPGAGGSIAFADPEVGLSVAITINKMATTLTAEGPVFELCEFIRNELGVNA